MFAPETSALPANPCGIACEKGASADGHFFGPADAMLGSGALLSAFATRFLRVEGAEISTPRKLHTCLFALPLPPSWCHPPHLSSLRVRPPPVCFQSSPNHPSRPPSVLSPPSPYSLPTLSPLRFRPFLPQCPCRFSQIPDVRTGNSRGVREEQRVKSPERAEVTGCRMPASVCVLPHLFCRQSVIKTCLFVHCRRKMGENIQFMLIFLRLIQKKS